MKAFAIVALTLVGGCGACAKPSAPAEAVTAGKSQVRARGAPRCFDVTTGQNSATTRAEFATRHCQGGGVTWAALLRVLVGRRGRITPAEEPSLDMTGDVSLLDGRVRFSIDEEGDAARFCSDAHELVASMQADFERINGELEELRRAMAEAEPVALECLLADGGFPALPAKFPAPKLPSAVLAEVREQLARTRQVLEKHPAWCFPDDEPHRWKGVLHFSFDGGATQTFIDGGFIAQGAWRWPPTGSGDSRIEVRLHCSGVAGCVVGPVHYDVGESGRLGYLLGEHRQELLPDSVCLRR